MSFWSKLFGARKSTKPVTRPSAATPVLQPKQTASPTPSQPASRSPDQEASVIFIWDVDVMPSLYGQAAQEAICAAFKVALKPDPAKPLGLEGRAGDLLGGNPIQTFRAFLSGLNATTVNLDSDLQGAIQSGTAVTYVPYVVVLNAKSRDIQLAHEELRAKQTVGYLGMVTVQPVLSLSTVESRLSLPLASLQVCSGQREPTDPQILQLLDQAERESDKPKAVAMCDQVIAKDPLCSDAHNLRGWLLEKLDRIDEAEAAYRRAIEIDPNQAPALWHLSYIVGSKRNNPREAVQLIDRVIALKPPFLPRAIHERANYAARAGIL